MVQMHNPVHPGKIVEEFCNDLKKSDGLSRNVISKHLHITPGALSNVINGKAAITATMAIKLQKAFGMSAQTWLRMQEQYDLWLAEKSSRKEKISPLIVTVK
jgi:addiction module HigA family antidote